MQTRARTRIVGVDTARGLAVLGMFVAHLGMERHSEIWTTTGWFFLGDGRPSALFAMLAGIGLVFMTRRAQDDPARFAFQRGRILRRALILYLLGYGLVFLGTPVAVILPAYAVLFVVAVPFLRMSAMAVLGCAGIVLAIGPQILVLTRHAFHGEAGPVHELALLPGLAEVWSGYYPAITWLAYILVGVAVGKTDLRSPRVATALLGIGSVVAALGYGAGAFAEGALVGREGTIAFDLITIEPHANSTPEMLGNAGFAVALLGLCLLAMSLAPLRVIATPLNAVGAMSLTIYSLHIVYIAILGADAVWYPVSNWPLIWLVLASLAFALIWQKTLGQGPVERLLARLIGSRRPPASGPGPTPPGSHHQASPQYPAPAQHHVPPPPGSAQYQAPQRPRASTTPPPAPVPHYQPPQAAPVQHPPHQQHPYYPASPDPQTPATHQVPVQHQSPPPDPPPAPPYPPAAPTPPPRHRA
ncbi:heparan-alpha-glucosaminide N-acetyltransferase domain-containing protein [Pseudactinotalea sp. Z1748]|uniref:DUF418 domain-containing protein n=1 Tax=Pseudactinotalea sp. Z1748 TaxID=3413027 RepID=UPI003C7C3438